MIEQPVSRWIVIALALIGLLWAGAAQAADTKTYQITNRTGVTASDLHVTFSGTGGDLEAVVVVNPPGCPVPKIPSNGQITNTLVLDWGVDCVANEASVTVRVSTRRGPLLPMGGIWTSRAKPGAPGIGPVDPEKDIAEVEEPEDGSGGGADRDRGSAESPDGTGHRLVVPALVTRGVSFSGLVVESTPQGERPAPSGTRVSVGGRVIETRDGGEVDLPAITESQGNVFLHASFPDDAEPQEPPHHLEVVPGRVDLATRLDHASDVLSPGGYVRCEGQGLTGLERAALIGSGEVEVPLGEGFGSDLQRIFSVPADLAPGSYRFVAWDHDGRRHEAPETSLSLTVEMSGTAVTTVGQRGQITLRSDADLAGALSSGEPEIRLDRSFVVVRAGESLTVPFTALRVGEYTVDFTSVGLQDAGLLPQAPTVDFETPPTLEVRPRPGRGDTVVTSRFQLDAGDQPIAGTSVDVAVSHPGGIEHQRVLCDRRGRAELETTVPGQVSAVDVSIHPYRVHGYRWDPGKEAVEVAFTDACKEEETFTPGREEIDVAIDDSYGSAEQRKELEEGYQEEIETRGERFRISTPTATSYTFYRGGLVGGAGNALAKTILADQQGQTDAVWTTEKLETEASGNAQIRIQIEAPGECTTRITEATLVLVETRARIFDPIEDAEEAVKAAREFATAAKDLAGEVIEEIPIVDKIFEWLNEQADPTAFVEMGAEAAMRVRADDCREQKVRVRSVAELVRQGEETKKLDKLDVDLDYDIDSCSVAAPRLDIDLAAEGKLTARAEGTGAGENYLGSVWANLWVSCCQCPRGSDWNIDGSLGGYFDSKEDMLSRADELHEAALNRVADELEKETLDPCDPETMRRRLEKELDSWIHTFAKQRGLYKGTDLNPAK